MRLFGFSDKVSVARATSRASSMLFRTCARMVEDHRSYHPHCPRRVHILCHSSSLMRMHSNQNEHRAPHLSLHTGENATLRDQLKKLAFVSPIVSTIRA